MTFKPGQSGNPAGKPKGARARTTLEAEAMLDEKRRDILGKAITMAIEGDPIALRLCLERILPPVKSRPVTLDLSEATDAEAAIPMIQRAMLNGEIDPESAMRAIEVLIGKRQEGIGQQTVVVVDPGGNVRLPLTPESLTKE